MDWPIKSAGFLEIGIVFGTNENFEKNFFFERLCVVTQKNTYDGRTTWIVKRNEKTIVFIKRLKEKQKRTIWNCQMI